MRFFRFFEELTYDPPVSGISECRFGRPRWRTAGGVGPIASAGCRKTRRTLFHGKTPRRSQMTALNVLCPSAPSVHPSALAMHCAVRVLLHWWPQQAWRRLGLSGCVARDERRLMAADEHADRPPSCRFVLRDHMLTAHAHDGWRAKIGGLVVHACDFFGCSTLAWQHILSVCVGRVRETGCGGRVRV